MDLIYLKTKFPGCYTTNMNDIKRLGKGTCSFGISIADLGVVFNEDKERRILIQI